GDNVITFLERGFPVGGTTEAGASVTVTFVSATYTVAADANGIWSAGPFGAIDLPLLGGSFPLSAVATDQNGNPGPATIQPIQVEPIGIAIMPQELLAADEDIRSSTAITSASPDASSAASIGIVIPAADPLQMPVAGPSPDPLVPTLDPIPH